jgi:hypothetical protein
VVLLHGRLQYVTSHFIRELPILSACVDIDLKVCETKIIFFPIIFFLRFDVLQVQDRRCIPYVALSVQIATTWMNVSIFIP